MEDSKIFQWKEKNKLQWLQPVTGFCLYLFRDQWREGWK